LRKEMDVWCVDAGLNKGSNGLNAIEGEAA
jgi:hypothetical protein